MNVSLSFQITGDSLDEGSSDVGVEVCVDGVAVCRCDHRAETLCNVKSDDRRSTYFNVWNVKPGNSQTECLASSPVIVTETVTIVTMTAHLS